MIFTATHQSKKIDEGIIDLKRSIPSAMYRLSTLKKMRHWTQMWMYYFLMGNKPIYLKYSTYWNATPLEGEWTLKTNLDIIHSTIRNDPLVINDCCYLEKNVTFNATFGEGWYYPESNDTLRWRWTGAHDQSSSIILYLAEPRQIDLDLTYWSLDPGDELAVMIDTTPLQVCSERNHCRISDINLTSGSHILTLKTKLPPQSAGNRDTRTLSYAYSNITFSESA